MAHQLHTNHQVFGHSYVRDGASLFQGILQQYFLPPSLIPELVTHLQQRLSAQTDSTNPDRIFRSVAQLGFLNKKERVTLTGSDARCVLDNVGNVLEALASPPAFDRGMTQGPDTNKRDCSSHHDALAAVKKILHASEYVGVNQPHAIRRKVSRGSTCTVLSRLEDKFDIAHAQVRVYAWKRRLLSSRRGNSTRDEFTMRIDVQPQLEGDPGPIPCISIYLQQIRGLGRSSFVDPMIVARRVVPDSSPVFQMVKDGDFGGFMRLLQNRQASLWDCDSQGCSLINYAIYRSRSEMCKFLIENGADIDSIEPLIQSPVSSFLPLLSHTMLNLEGDGYSPAWRIFRDLLEAGADPSVGNQYSPLSLATSIHNGEYMKEVTDQIFHFGHEYVDAKACDYAKRTALLAFCADNQTLNESTCSIIDRLIALGFSLDDRDQHGDTCLHLIWRVIGRDRKNPVDYCMLVYHLLDLGADVNALNARYETPSDKVSSTGNIFYYKVWDLALYVKGIKVDDWEAKKQKIHEQRGIDFTIPPLPERDDRISGHDWLESVWSEAAAWVTAEQDAERLWVKQFLRVRRRPVERKRWKSRWSESEWPEAEEEGGEAKTKETDFEHAAVEVEAEKVEETESEGTESKEVELPPEQPLNVPRSMSLLDFWF